MIEGYCLLVPILNKIQSKRRVKLPKNKISNQKGGAAAVCIAAGSEPEHPLGFWSCQYVKGFYPTICNAPCYNKTIIYPTMRNEPETALRLIVHNTFKHKLACVSIQLYQFDIHHHLSHILQSFYLEGSSNLSVETYTRVPINSTNTPQNRRIL